MLAPPGEDRSSSLRGGNGRSRTRIMGILNVTPDSFSDGGRFNRLDAAVAQARKMAAEGADIIDVGGESTRPGYLPIDADEELARVLPVLEAIVPIVGIPVSIDTRKSAVARAALRAGARMVNDIWGLQRDPTLAELAAEADVETIAMHNRDTVDPAIDIIDDMLRFFEVTIDIARRAGIREDRLILDPGIGFGKTLEQNLRAVKHIGAIRALGFPVLLGVSRKSSIGRITGREVGDRLAGTIAMNAWALRDGVDIIRVHDVAEHVDARAISEALRDA
ncbi:dihydropteroate synthase [Tepidamorphus gemmatus]|uniref:Dihydropteroate synthase n=1 Tax=Tepidamorphus gemmatus TaxID=747076 RepID=A0A4R3M7R9_9HYPH|nr:dihydropteroate synthase [Tepidamorphus gemmatus]TCT08329.1 dihydropteroate synthase [Tepidamorphus gemmatus]